MYIRVSEEADQSSTMISSCTTNVHDRVGATNCCGFILGFQATMTLVVDLNGLGMPAMLAALVVDYLQLCDECKTVTSLYYCGECKRFWCEDCLHASPGQHNENQHCVVDFLRHK